MFCKECGEGISEKASICMKCGVATDNSSLNQGNKEKTTYMMLGIFLGGLGVHNFYAGYTGRGVAQLLISILSLGLLYGISWIWAIIEVCTIKEDAQGNNFSK